MGEEETATGDARFDPAYVRVRDAEDRVAALRELSDVDIVRALAAASREHEPFLANILATEAENRIRRAGVAAATAPECIITIDREARVVYANDAALELLGCARADLVGRVAWEAIDVFDERGRHIPHHQRPSFAALQGDAGARGEVDVRRSDGSRVRCVYLAAPAHRDGEIDGAVIVFHRAQAP